MTSRESPLKDPRPRRARGANSNVSGRFETHERIAVEDGWDITEDRPLLRTEFHIDASRSVLVRNTSPDVPFDLSLNPYRGCEHGCIYCFARPSHAFLGLSPGLDFETRILVKPDAPALLKKALARPGYRPATIALGTNTDPYQPVEKRLKIMRGILEVLAAHRHPVAIVTKGALVRRDVDILGTMAADNLAAVGVSLTTLDPDLCRRLEPRAAAPATRLAAIRALADAGIPVRAMIAPVIPGLTDHEMESLVAAAAAAGATTATYITIRLPLEIADLFREWLAEHRPDRAARVLSRIRDLHGGALYDAAFGKRMRGEGVLADLLDRRFDVALKRQGLAKEGPDLATHLFRVPGRTEQLSLFEPGSA